VSAVAEISPGLVPKAFLDEFAQWLIEGRGNAPATAKNYVAAVSDFYSRMGLESPAQVTSPKIFDRFSFRLYSAKLGLDTRRAKLHALRVYFRWLFTRGYLPNDLSSQIEVPRGKETKLIPVFSRSEIRRLIETRTSPPARSKKEPKHFYNRRLKSWALTEARDPFLLALAYSLGLRVSELADIQHDDIVTVKGRVYLTIREGKDSTEPRRFRLDPNLVVPRLQIYLSTLDEWGIRHPALFPPLSRNAYDSAHGIGRDSVALILKARVEAAGINPNGRRIRPHMLRYSRATHMYQHHPMIEITALLRHKRSSTTERYIRLGSLAAISGRANKSLPWNRPDLDDGLS
jgi:site-specific recombinase XerD